MKRFTAQPDPAAHEWRNLRDERGRYYGRVNRVQMLLEIRTNKHTTVFDLKAILEIRQIEAKETSE
jgi:hypothetical protein